ncbi:MAG: outer membrane beta-barrel protein [Bacteroidia bacterium]|nr:outer membrane beta-barrel protein [Bacteroidia bacterium]
MKHLILIALALITLTAKPQDTTVVITSPKWQVGVLFSPDVTTGVYRFYPYGYKASFGFATGLNASRKLNKHFRLDFGLLYAQRNDGLKDLVLSVDYRNGFSYDTLASYKLKNNFIEIPLKLKWQFKQCKRFIFHAIIGASANILVKSTSKFTYYNGTTNEVYSTEKHTTNFTTQTILPSALIGIGMEYKLNSKLNIVLQPEYRTYFLSGYGHIETLTALGVNCGVSYGF